MSQILVRDLEPRVVSRLKERAKSMGRSLEAEVRSILSKEAEKDTMEEARAKAIAFREQFKGRKFSDSAELIREDRDR